jgi:hypothetical protein
MMTLQTYELRIQRSIETAHRQLRAMQQDAAARAEAEKASPPPPAAPVKPATVAPLILLPADSAANVSAGQQLEPDWVRSSESPGSAGPLVPESELEVAS